MSAITHALSERDLQALEQAEQDGYLTQFYNISARTRALWMNRCIETGRPYTLLAQPARGCRVGLQFSLEPVRQYALAHGQVIEPTLVPDPVYELYLIRILDSCPVKAQCWSWNGVAMEGVSLPQARQTLIALLAHWNTAKTHQANRLVTIEEAARERLQLGRHL